MSRELDLEHEGGGSLELDLSDPSPPRPAPVVLSALAVPRVASSPPVLFATNRAPLNRAARIVLVLSVLLGLPLAIAGGLFARSLLVPKDERFELKRWSRDSGLARGDHYAYFLGAPDGVARTLSCDRLVVSEKAEWTCSCLEAGVAARTVKTDDPEPPTRAVQIARRAQELCGWPYWAECPRQDWLACTLFDR